MNTKKTSDPPEVPVCLHPEHNPPTHMVYPRGKYRHVCPGCRHETVFVVSGAVW